MCASVYCHVYVEYRCPEVTVTDPLELELWAAPWMLGPETAVSAGVANAPNCSVSSLAQFDALTTTGRQVVKKLWRVP